MDKDRFQRVQALFEETADQPAHQRLAFLTAASGGDEELVSEVQALLAEDARGSLLDQDLAQMATRIFARENPSPAPIQEFGPYKIRDLLGEGGMGVVYLAEREDLGSLAAIKLLPDAWMSPARRERFSMEQRTLAQLTHPSIARLYDADTLPDGTPWFAMEYVKGVPLTEYCRQQTSSLAERVKVLASVCEAVRYAHSRAVIHRDLKPANILVQSDGSVKLLDFGIAKQLDQLETPANQTRTALRLMTPAYAAPEQLRGGQVGTYTDVYALGVILYELLTGKLPFDAAKPAPGGSEGTLANQQPVKPSLSAPDEVAGNRGMRLTKTTWADLDVLCLTAMHHNPERRYGSIDAFIRDLNHFLAGEPLEARSDTLGYRIQKFVQRNRQLVAVTALGLVSMAGLVIFYTMRLATARNAALAEAARTQRVLQFTLNLFSGGDLVAGPAGDLRVTTLLDRGLIAAGSLNRDPAEQAEMYETLGEVYQKLGALDRANSLLSSALGRRRSLFGANNAKVAESLVKLGLLRADQAKFEEAERLVRQGLQISRAILNAGDPGIAEATHALGKVLEDGGSYKEAHQVLTEAVRLRSAPGGNTADLAASQLELANTYFYTGQFDEAESLYRRLLIAYRQQYGERHPMVAEDLINLGAIQQERGKYKEAEAFHRQALDITQAFYGKDHYKTASSLTLVARALVFQHRFDEAVEMLHRALAIQEKVFGKSHPRVASALNDLGNVAVLRNQLAEAAADFGRIVGIYRSAYGGKHYLIGIALANLGGVYLARKDNVGAEHLFREALAMYGQTLPAGSLNEGITRIKLGRALLREKRFTEAEIESLAGYQTVSKQHNPGLVYLQRAREDLVATYAALGQPEKARQFSAEQLALSQ